MGKTDNYEVTISNIEDQQSQLFDVIKDLIEKVAENSQKLDKLLNGHFNDMRENLSRIESDVTQLQGDFADLKEKVNEMKKEE